MLSSLFRLVAVYLALPGSEIRFFIPMNISRRVPEPARWSIHKLTTQSSDGYSGGSNLVQKANG